MLIFQTGRTNSFFIRTNLNNSRKLQTGKEEGNNEKAILTLTFSEDAATPISNHKFILWGNAYVFHRLDKSLNLNWNTPPIGETRTSPAPPPSYTLEEIAGGEPGTGKQISFTLSEQEIPAGILP